MSAKAKKSATGSAAASRTGTAKDGKAAKGKGAADDAADGGKSKADLEEDIKKLTEELNSEREERNLFQLERDKITSFWDITKSELSQSKADQLNKDRELEELEEKHQVYKQKVKHLLYEYQNNVAHLQADSERALQIDQEDHDIIKNLKQKQDEEITQMRNDFERRAKELHGKYDKKMKVVRDDLELKRKNEIHEIEERKNGQINALMKNHDKAFGEIKNYYNDITLNNLALINSLKEQVEDMKKKEERNEKQMADFAFENKRLSKPLQAALSECDTLKRQLQSYDKDKLLEDRHKALSWEHEVLEQRFGQVQKERDDLYEGFVDRIVSVQQKTGFENLVLEKKVESLRDMIEKRDLQVNEILKATNLDPGAMAGLSRRLEEVLDVKNRQIKELQYDLAKVTKAHNDMIRTYEAKLTEFSIPVEELGFKPLVMSAQPQPNAAGLVAAQ
ncbi:Dynein regulatory complex subunit 4 [Thoreauomyces humboldtii]|nr:Dynein regulatory complex subunit 4 [Thoreauomyces humboldtii]